MRLGDDESALESIPLRLMIVAVVVSMSVIPASQALENLRDGDFVRRAEAQLDLVVSTAEVLAIEGPGGVRTIELDFRSEGSLRFRSMVVGDSVDGPNVSAVVLRLSNGGTIVRTADSPTIMMISGSGGGLTIASSYCCLRLSCEVSGACPRILAESI
ncbi:MAG: hypothetical protein MUC90_06550 [Thermoplasmata archaeon]|jgi:hypothetical protein|nr:hypothetical protein [Thermoplasmata archaeon]